MTLRIADRVQESSTTTGTGAFTLAGAYTGYIRFSAVPSIVNGDTLYYCIEALDGNGNPSGDWETGLGTYSSANTLTRTTPAASSNAGAAVNFAAGNKRVSLDATAGLLALYAQKANNLSDLTNAGTARTNLGLAIGSDVQGYDADLADIAAISDAQGDIIIRGAAGWERLPAGTAGQHLKTGGASANPSWGGMRAAMVKKVSDQTTANYSTATNVAWDGEVYDTDSFHSKASTVTITIASPGVVSWTAHGLIAGQPIVFSTTGALPTGLVAGTTYFVLAPATDSFNVAATAGGAAINTSGSQSGVQTATTGNTSLVVPAGVTYVRVGYRIYMTSVSAASDIVSVLFKNGNSQFDGGTGQSHETSAFVPLVSASSGPIPVTAGDFFEVNLQNSDTSITFEGDFLSNFWIEIIQ